MADPELTGVEAGSRGGFASLIPQPLTRDTVRQVKPNTSENGLFYQTRVTPVGGNGFDFTAQATVSPDGSTTWVKLSPVFESLNRGGSSPVVVNPMIPGAPDFSARR
jgi:hypothetical protein